MKVLYFHQHFSTAAGASSTRSYEMAKRLISRGYEVTMVCGSYAHAKTGVDEDFVSFSREGIVDGIKVIELNLKYANSDNFLKRSFTFLKFSLYSIFIALQRDHDIIFATSTPLTVGIPGVFSKWIRRKQFIFEVRDLWPELPKAMGVIRNPIVLKLLSALEYICYHSADHLISLSPGITKGIIAKGIKPERVTMIPNGCDIELFQSEVKSSSVDFINEDFFYAIYAGTHGLANGLDVVVEACKELQILGEERVKVILVGDGSQKKRLQQFAVDGGLKNILFLDPVDKRSLSEIFSKVQVGLQILSDIPAFYYGTSPNKFFDYLAAGKAVIVNYPGWISDMVNNYRCGCVVKPSSPSDIANALINLCNNRALVQDFSRNSKKLAQEKFNRSDLANDFVDVFERLLNQMKK